jgi:hypothetical protein
MMGWYRVFECEKGFRDSDRDCLSGFLEPCDYYQNCFTDRMHSKDGKSHFRYNRIKRSEMRESKNCLEDKKEEQERNTKERERLRNEAFELLKQAEAIK